MTGAVFKTVGRVREYASVGFDSHTPPPSPRDGSNEIPESHMTRTQQLGAWLLFTALLAIALYRWFNLPQ